MDSGGVVTGGVGVQGSAATGVQNSPVDVVGGATLAAKTPLPTNTNTGRREGGAGRRNSRGSGKSNDSHSPLEDPMSVSSVPRDDDDDVCSGFKCDSNLPRGRLRVHDLHRGAAAPHVAVEVRV